MQLPAMYRTGNKKMDEKIAIAFQKNPDRPTQLKRIVDANGGLQQKQNKYHVSEKEERTYSDGTLFASKAEMERWHYLVMLEKAGEIMHLQKQVPFVLQEEFISKQYGLIRPVLYVADFVYVNLTFRPRIGERLVIEDSKTGMRTEAYKTKRKIMLYKYAEYLFYEV